jgi:hypothetical protein
VRLSLVLLVLLSGCVGVVGEEATDAGAGLDGGDAMDGGVSDAGITDAGTIDAGTIDAGTIDGGTIDGGTIDGGTTDAGTTDAGTTDAGTTDAGTTDAGTTDAGTTDAGTTDAGTTDAGTTDAGVPLQRAAFTPTDALAPDPERGFFRFTSELTQVTASELNAVANQGHRLVYSLLRLDDVRTTSIGATRLAAIATGLSRIRAAGLKVIMRPVYNYPASETEYQNAQDATLAQVQAHLQELAPVFAANADVIAFFQAGFIGAWGEWHTSSNNLTSTANKLLVRDALLQHLPASRTVSFRYPPDLRNWYPTVPTLDERLSGQAPRVGFHNDCFMASPTDVGTYPTGSSGTTLRQHMQAFGQVAPFGGETCNPVDDPSPTPRLGCADILSEGPAYGLTYLNRDYWTTFHNAWVSGGCFEQVQRSLGHRLRLVELELPTHGTPGATLQVRVSLANDGWARMHNARPLVLWLRSGSMSERLDVTGVDVRRVGAGQTVVLTGGVTLPGTLTAGTWNIDVALPDAAASLAGDSRYATRLFNADVAVQGQRWNGSTGRFETGLSLEVP